MFDAEAMTERHGLILAELAEIGMAIVRELKGQALEAEAPEARARAVAAFPKVARAVRQSLALEARLRRDLTRHQRETARDAERAAELRLRRRKAQVRLYVEGAIDAACPDGDALDDEALTRLEDLDDRLADDLLDPDFADIPFPEAVARLHRALGLDPPDFGPRDDPIPTPSGKGDHAQHGGGGFRSESHPPGGPPQSACADSSPDGGATDPRSSA